MDALSTGARPSASADRRTHLPINSATRAAGTTDPVTTVIAPAPGRQRTSFAGLLQLDVAPTSSNFFFMASASALDRPSLTGLGGAVDQVLGFLQPEVGDLADDLDDVDLLVAGALQDEGEFGLDFLGLGLGGGGRRRRPWAWPRRR